MERNGKSGALTNFILLLGAGMLCFGVGRYSLTFTGQLTSYVMGFGVLATLMSWFHMRLEEQERLEQMEFDELAGSRGGASLFNTAGEDTFLSRRSLRLFERFFIPIATGLLAVAQGTAAVLCWRWIDSASIAPSLQQPVLALGIFGGVFLALFLIGQYSSGVARLDNRRLLRPSANLMLLGAYLAAFTAVILVIGLAEVPRIDIYGGRLICLLLGAQAVESFFAVILEIYRPRVKGKVVHPLYDSRLTGLVSHPEGVFSTAATALDYQFGFKVSDTWFYQFLRTNFPWIVMAQLGLLFVSSGLVFVNPGEQALLERLGRPVAGREVLGPGLHVKWPYPIDQIHRYRTEEVQSFTVGGVPLDDGQTEVAFLWTVSHLKEDFNLLVPSRALSTVTNVGGSGSGFSNSPLSFLTASIPIHFQISDLRAYAYNYQNSSNLVEQVANREVSRYFAQTDIQDLLSSGQSTAAEHLRTVIQKQVDELQLGVKLLFVGLQDIHPPTQVAKDYEGVVDARQGVETNILSARSFSSLTNAQATANADRILGMAHAASEGKIGEATASAARFRSQVKAFQASPEVYPHRQFLKAYTNALFDTRKVIVALTNVQLVPQLDLQEKISGDVFNRLTQPRKAN